MRVWASVLIAGVGASAPGCAYYSAEQGRRLHDEVYALSAQLNAMQSRLQALEAQKKEDQARLQRIDGEVSNFSASARRNDADTGVQVDQILEEIAALKGQMASVDERMAALAQPAAALPPPTEPPKAEPAAPVAPAEPKVDPNDGKAILAAARADLKAKKYATARSALRGLIKRAASQSKLKAHRAQAQYLIAESYFEAGDHRKAVAEYNLARKKYRPSRKQVARSLYKLGRCLEALGLKKDARVFYDEVVRKYRKYDVAEDAKKRRAKLSKAK